MSRVIGGALVGVDGVPVEVEVRISSQLPRVDVVGLPEAAVRESASRVRAAIGSEGLPFPDRRVTVNLAPASLRKSGAGLDLPIAIGILAAAGVIETQSLERLGLLGQLALDGRVRGVRGALAQVLALAAAGCDTVIAPRDNGCELALAPEIRVGLASSLGEVVAALRDGVALPAPTPVEVVPQLGDAPDLALLRGQDHARRALEIAAAGGHGLLLLGAPGAGKTLLARSLPGVLPPLEREEALEVTRIRSAAGLVESSAPLARERPFRAPHHSASRAGLLGGGNPPGPGEVSLAHCGALFLDELPEFDRPSLEALRQVLEDGGVALARAGRRLWLPARFQLVAAANPCPCGWYRSGARDCRCDDAAIARYASRLSGPLLDRIDLHVGVRPLPWRDLDASGGAREASASVRARVIAARARQASRLAPLARTNAEIPLGALDALVDATPDARALLARAVDRFALSARAAHRALRVARSIADLGEERRVGVEAMAEAVVLRGHAERRMSGAEVSDFVHCVTESCHVSPAGHLRASPTARTHRSFPGKDAPETTARRMHPIGVRRPHMARSATIRKLPIQEAAAREEVVETTLLELVQTIGELTSDDREVVTTVVEMLHSGRVRLIGNFRGQRIAVA